MKAPLPSNELARLDALQQYQVLDTAPEATFDELTQLAAQICQTSMASLTFIDRERQWHKSNFGIEMNEVSRDVSFCAHTVASGELLVVADPQQDERFADNPFVVGESGLRFYAGTPLVTPEGLSIGSLCVFDTVAHEIQPAQLQALCVLGRQAVAQLELRPDFSELANDAAADAATPPASQSRRQRLQQRRHERAQAAHELQRADERYRNLFEAVAEGILLVEAQSGWVEEISASLSDILGDELPLLNRRIWQIAALQPLFPSESKWVLVRKTLHETGHISVPEIALTALDGRQIWIEFRAHLYQSAGRALVRVHLRDITKNKLDRDALHAQQRHRAMLLQLSLNGIVIMNQHGVITEWNPAAEKMFGHTRAQVVGQDLAEIIVPPQLRPMHRAGFARHLQTGQSHILGQRVEVTAMRADGSEFPMELTVARYDDEQDGPIFVASLRDITERINAQNAMQRAKDELETRVIERTAELSETNAQLQLKIADLQRAEERLAASAQRLRGVLESISDAFVALDEFWRFTYINDQALRLMNKSCDDLLGRDVEAGFPGIRDIIFEEDGQQIAQQGEPIKRETYYAPWKIWLEIHAYPSEEGLSIYFQDISARRAAQFALEEAKREADAANAAKSEFLGRMSHELRTPLNAILGFGQILDKQNLTAPQGESVGYILRSGAHLLDLINEVLDITRVETGQSEISLEAIALEQAVADACAIVRPLAQARAIHIRLPALDKALDVAALDYVRADRQRLAQILINLLSNAIKYNFDNGEIEVSWRAEKGGRVAVSVRDNGPGIAPETLPRLFVPFERGAAANSKIEGTGLGLALTRGLVEAMGGAIAVESAPGRGCTVSFDLLRAPAPAPVSAPQVAAIVAPAPIQRKIAEAPCTYRVLCIEDNLSNLRLIELLLAARPEITLISAQLGAQGLELARQHEPDLILLDLNLPDTHGSQVLQQLQSVALTRDIPVVVVSADATPTQIETLLDAGACDYLTKPLDMRRLLQVLDRILQPVAHQSSLDCEYSG